MGSTAERVVRHARVRYSSSKMRVSVSVDEDLRSRAAFAPTWAEKLSFDTEKMSNLGNGRKEISCSLASLDNDSGHSRTITQNKTILNRGGPNALPNR